MGTGGILDPFSDYTMQELSDEQIATAVAIAHRAGRRVMVHAEGTSGIKAAVRAGVDSIEHGTMLDEEGAQLMERKGTWLVPTLYTFQFGAEMGEKIGLEPVMLAKVRRILSAQGPAFRRALAHHVRIAARWTNADFGAKMEIADIENHRFGQGERLVIAKFACLGPLQILDQHQCLVKR